ncbi:hypothetical protein JHN55_21655 [Streptomyces sp. MBT56]|uniref:hypothetical protein n=1 Tax=unclassified Streptomyces TaxID=2593676 RepID=UPI00190B4081|nr:MULTISPECIES: hypothetical protein [unclassified Streptomyces]MBK3559081.1 hypothetical protein [Streptomyces sp. MBT56]MBK3605869.1 hypothetical protein [Streptomyces sp. MBT54]MBK3619249.1 hypothetical protein [Streptomyces sp. MBT98]
MSMRRTTTTRRAMTAVTLTAALALALAGCGDDGGDEPGNEGSSAPSAPASPSAEDKGDSQQDDTAAGENVDPDAKLAEARGQSGLTLVINQVKRDSGGFVTVQGEIKNGGSSTQNTSNWVGQESALVAKNPNSVAGATLVDKGGKKNYYVLRDTDGRCLCTTAIVPLSPGESASVFMQFPAPPAETTEVDFTLPTFATTSLKISG